MAKKLIFRQFDEHKEEAVLESQRQALNQIGTNGQETSAQVVPFTPPEELTRNRSYIEKNVIINGSIASEHPMQIDGTLKGDLNCDGDVDLGGNVEGNVKASNLTVNLGSIDGDVICSGGMVMAQNTKITGNITAESIECNGMIEGNTTVSGDAVILGSAVVFGDITAATISVERGAVINGVMKIKRENEKTA